MKMVSSKEFCIWVVPGQSGKVKKVRVSLARIVLAGLCLSAFVGFFLFIMGDYGRLQLMRAQEFVRVEILHREKESLVTENQELKATVESLRTANSRVITYEQNVRQRMDEIAAAIETASSLGLMPAEVKKKGKGEVEKDKRGIGGLETDCRPGQKGCEALEDSRARPDFARLFAGKSDEDLIEALDSYIDLIKLLPISSPGNGYVNSGYGSRVSPFTGKLKRHEGVDFSLPLGSQVFATGDGVVKAVRRNATYGLVVDIAHNGKVTTRYAHLSKALVKQGQKVCRGQAVGLVGSTGRSTGPHLHYEVRINDRTINPTKMFQIAEKLSGTL